MNPYVQYGSGFHAPKSWRNFDSDFRTILQKIPLGKTFIESVKKPVFPDNVEYGDIVHGLPVAPGSCRAIYCSHVLEHLALEDFRIALKNTYSYLDFGGVFRFVLPDLRFYAEEYLASDDPNAAKVFMGKTYLGKERKPNTLIQFWKSRYGCNEHLWMWDFPAISVELKNVGFRDICRASFGDSNLSIFLDVENPTRWINAVGVECSK